MVHWKKYNLKDLLFFIIIQFEKHIYTKWKKNGPKEPKLGAKFLCGSKFPLEANGRLISPLIAFAWKKKRFLPKRRRFGEELAKKKGASSWPANDGPRAPHYVRLGALDLLSPPFFGLRATHCTCSGLLVCLPSSNCKPHLQIEMKIQYI